MANEDIIIRINELIDFYQCNKTEFARKIKVEKSGLSKRLNGHVATGPGTINKIILGTGVSRSWLVDGEGEMFDNKKENYPENNNLDLSNEPKVETYTCIDCIEKQKIIDGLIKETDFLKEIIKSKEEALSIYRENSNLKRPSTGKNSKAG